MAMIERAIAREEVLMKHLFLVGILVLSAAATARAQAPAAVAGDVGVSYSFLRILEGDGENLPAGWLASFAGRVTPAVSVVGEVGGNYKSESGQTLKLHTFQGGVRVSSGTSVEVRPYAQFLVGGMNLTCCGEGVTHWMVEPGGGVDVPINRRTAVRFGVGVPVVFSDGDTSKALRLHAGVVFQLGSR